MAEIPFYNAFSGQKNVLRLNQSNSTCGVFRDELCSAYGFDPKKIIVLNDGVELASNVLVPPVTSTSKCFIYDLKALENPPVPLPFLSRNEQTEIRFQRVQTESLESADIRKIASFVDDGKAIYDAIVNSFEVIKHLFDEQMIQDNAASEFFRKKKSDQSKLEETFANFRKRYDPFEVAATKHFTNASFVVSVAVKIPLHPYFGTKVQTLITFAPDNQDTLNNFVQKLDKFRRNVPKIQAQLQSNQQHLTDLERQLHDGRIQQLVQLFQNIQALVNKAQQTKDSLMIEERNLMLSGGNTQGRQFVTSKIQQHCRDLAEAYSNLLSYSDAMVTLKNETTKKIYAFLLNCTSINLSATEGNIRTYDGHFSSELAVLNLKVIDIALLPLQYGQFLAELVMEQKFEEFCKSELQDRLVLLEKIQVEEEKRRTTHANKLFVKFIRSEPPKPSKLFVEFSSPQASCPIPTLSDLNDFIVLLENFKTDVPLLKEYAGTLKQLITTCRLNGDAPFRFNYEAATPTAKSTGASGAIATANEVALVNKVKELEDLLQQVYKLNREQQSQIARLTAKEQDRFEVISKNDVTTISSSSSNSQILVSAVDAFNQVTSSKVLATLDASDKQLEALRTMEENYRLKKQEAEELQTRVTTLERDLKRVQLDLSHISQERNEAMCVVAQSGRVAQDNELLKQEKQDLLDRLANMEKNVEESTLLLQKKTDEFLTSLQKKDQELASLKADYDRVCEENKANSDEFVNVMTLEEENKRTLAVQKEKEELQSQLEQIKSECEKFKSVASTMQEQLDQSNVTIASLTKELQESQKDTKELQTHFDEAKQQIATLESEKAQTYSKYDSIALSLENSIKENGELTKALSDLKDSFQTLETAKKHSEEELTKQTSSLQARAKQFEVQLVELQQAHSQLLSNHEELLVENKQLHLQTQALNEEKSTLERAVQTFQNENAAVKRDLVKTFQDFDRFKQDSAKAFSSLQEEKMTLQQHRDQNIQHQASWQQQTTFLQTELNTVRSKYESEVTGFRTEEAQLREHLAQMTQEKASLQQQNVLLQNELNTARSKYELESTRFHTEEAQLRNSLSAANSYLSNQQEALSKQKDAVQKLSKEKDALKQELTRAKAETADWQERFEEISANDPQDHARQGLQNELVSLKRTSTEGARILQQVITSLLDVCGYLSRHDRINGKLTVPSTLFLPETDISQDLAGLISIDIVSLLEYLQNACTLLLTDNKLSLVVRNIEMGDVVLFLRSDGPNEKWYAFQTENGPRCLLDEQSLIYAKQRSRSPLSYIIGRVIMQEPASSEISDTPCYLVHAEVIDVSNPIS